MLKEISCATHRETGISFSLDGPIPVMQHPLMDAYGQITPDVTMRVIRAQNLSRNDYVLGKPLPGFDTPLDGNSSSVTFQPASNYETKLWVDKEGAIRHQHTEIRALWSDELLKALQDGNRMLSEGEFHKLSFIAKTSMAVGVIHDDTGTSLLLPNTDFGPLTLFELSEYGPAINPRFTQKLPAKDSPNWQGPPPYQFHYTNLSDTTVFEVITALVYIPQYTGDLSVRERKAKLISGIILHATTPKEISERIKALVESDTLTIEELDKIVLPYARLEWVEE